MIKINVIIFLLMIHFSALGQNHRQFANWICGEYSINKKVNEVDVKIASSHILNLSIVDSNNYWLVEDMISNKTNNQRLMHLQLLDSGYVGMDVYELKKGKAINPVISLQKINLGNYQKVNSSQLLFTYYRKSNGFELLRNQPQLFYLDKYTLRLKCCNEFSSFYYEQSTENGELIFIKKTD